MELIEKAIEALKAMKRSHGMHGPCTHNDCPSCREAYQQANVALALLRSAWLRGLSEKAKPEGEVGHSASSPPSVTHGSPLSSAQTASQSGPPVLDWPPVPPADKLEIIGTCLIPMPRDQTRAVLGRLVEAIEAVGDWGEGTAVNSALREANEILGALDEDEA